MIIRYILWISILIAVATSSFAFGRMTAKPSLINEAAKTLGLSPWSGLIAGAVSDARSFVDGVRLDVCLQDTETLAEANESLRERLRTSERRLEESLAAKQRADTAMKEYYEQAKKAAEQPSCEEWANAPVCPNARGLLRSTDSNQSRVD